MTHSVPTIERYRGAMLGLAVGDALGTTLEFASPGSFSPILEMTGGGPFHLEPGQWTDDTSMALCMADSILQTGAFDPVDQLQRYVQWYRTGFLSSTGHCFDIGGTVRNALAHFEQTGAPYCGSTAVDTAGNGSLMRLAPVPLRWAHLPDEGIAKSGDSSRTTHGAATAVDACRYFGALLIGAVRGVDKSTLLSDSFTPTAGLWDQNPLVLEVETIAKGSFKCLQPPAIRSTGYVVDTLQAALWAFHDTSSFEEGCRQAVNLGGDADTCGAVFGQLAGAFYGEHGIPERWRAVLAKRTLIESYADRLHAAALA